MKLDHIIEIHPARDGGWEVKHHGAEGETRKFSPEEGHEMVSHVGVSSGGWPDLNEKEAEESDDKPVEEMSLGEYKNAYGQAERRQQVARDRFLRGRKGVSRP
jgi:hypothetical protein